MANPENLHSRLWKPGQSANPGGPKPKRVRWSKVMLSPRSSAEAVSAGAISSESRIRRSPRRT